MPLLAALALQAAAADPALVLPPSAAADAWAAVPADVVPAASPAPWPAWPDDPAWEEVGPWARWVDTVRAEAERDAPDPAARAALARLAAAQGRSLDAWEHFAAAGGDIAELAGLLPALVPGVGEEHAAGPGGLAQPLPDGVLLAPVLPPLHRAPEHGRPSVRRMELRGLRIGEAVVDLVVAVELDGVEVDLHHRGGGPATVRVRPPVPPDLAIGALYADWSRVEDPTAEVELRVVPDEEERAVWARFVRAETPWPERLPDALPAALAAGGLVVLHEPGDPAAPRLGRLATALGRVAGVPARAATFDAWAREPPGPGPAPTAIRFPAALPPERRDAKVAALLSLAERRALGLPARR